MSRRGDLGSESLCDACAVISNIEAQRRSHVFWETDLHVWAGLAKNALPRLLQINRLFYRDLNVHLT